MTERYLTFSLLLHIKFPVTGKQIYTAIKRDNYTTKVSGYKSCTNLFLSFNSLIMTQLVIRFWIGLGLALHNMKNLTGVLHPFLLPLLNDQDFDYKSNECRDERWKRASEEEQQMDGSAGNRTDRTVVRKEMGRQGQKD